ncbi:MAG: LysM peptidoglycan-binding domain-containing protein [Paracoccaceae bacterium]|nr:LysM peptidoglycan-binding domain-containing protein [Paracoccaceae bacterium]
MIRLALMSVAFVVVTAGLLWMSGDRPQAIIVEDQVTRAAPAPLDLTPALPQPAAVPAPAPQPVTPTPAPTQTASVPSVRPPAGRNDNDDVMEALRTMSYGIVSEFNKPDTPAAPTPQAATTPDPAAMQAALSQRLKDATPTPAPTRTYTVQEGDSLPGIAFKFYGSTVSYLSILQANPDQMSDPGDIRAGMVLIIPEL